MIFSAGAEINVFVGERAAANDFRWKGTSEIWKKIELLYVERTNATQFSEGH
jgi:hypothetical protein